MPEGDTLRRLADRIDAEFAGASITSSIVRHPRLALLDFTGRTLVSADAVGKHLFVRFDDGRSLHVHLLMDGRVLINRRSSAESWRRRFELHFGQRSLIGVDIPILGLVATNNEEALAGHLGPDLCGDYDHEVGLSRLMARPSMHLAAALLDQTVVAGFGNIYAVEVPFICGVSPFSAVDEVDQPGAVLSIGAALIQTNAALGPQNTTGKNLRRDDHFVLESSARRCPVCGARLERRHGSATPWRRRTAWCPDCQRGSTVDLARAAKLLALHPARRMVDWSTGELTTQLLLRSAGSAR